jgi:hypothetical protein
MQTARRQASVSARPLIHLMFYEATCNLHLRHFLLDVFEMTASTNTDISSRFSLIYTRTQRLRQSERGRSGHEKYFRI